MPAPVTGIHAVPLQQQTKVLHSRSNSSFDARGWPHGVDISDKHGHDGKVRGRAVAKKQNILYFSEICVKLVTNLRTFKRELQLNRENAENSPELTARYR